MRGAAAGCAQQQAADDEPGQGFEKAETALLVCCHCRVHLFFLLVVGLCCFFTFDIFSSRCDCGQSATYQSHPQTPSLNNPAPDYLLTGEVAGGTLQSGERKHRKTLAGLFPDFRCPEKF
jgi:hypothetical protein